MRVQDKYARAALEWMKIMPGDRPKYMAIGEHEIEQFIEELRQTTVGFIFPNRTAFDKNYVRMQIQEGALMWHGMKVIVKEHVLV